MYLVSGCVRELRRSNELHQLIKCFEAQGRQQMPRTVHALLRSFRISRYLLLPQRKAESVSVLHTSVLYEIRSFRETSWILRSKNNSLRTLYQVVYVCYGGLTELLPLNIWLLNAGCGSLRGKSALSFIFMKLDPIRCFQFYPNSYFFLNAGLDPWNLHVEHLSMPKHWLK
jgi:hypothetical protein